MLTVSGLAGMGEAGSGSISVDGGAKGSTMGAEKLAGVLPPTDSGEPTTRRRCSCGPRGRLTGSKDALTIGSGSSANLRPTRPSSSTVSDGTCGSIPLRSLSTLRNVSKIWLMLAHFTECMYFVLQHPANSSGRHSYGTPALIARSRVFPRRIHNVHDPLENSRPCSAWEAWPTVRRGSRNQPR